ncbi:TPA: hypothetical protein L3H17_002930 [Morganella morganii]|nr:hypothetical protein [Morganella morganii]
MSVMNKPDYKIFAQDAKSGEYVAFPDILRGWGITLEQYNGFPPMELFNSAAKRIDEWLMYLTQRGLPEWDAAVDYPKDAMIQHAGVYYVSLKVNKGEQPNNSQASWKKLTETLGVDGKLAKDKNGADIPDKEAFIGNLGLPELLDKKFNKTGGKITGDIILNDGTAKQDVKIRAWGAADRETVFEIDFGDEYALHVSKYKDEPVSAVFKGTVTPGDYSNFDSRYVSQKQLSDEISKLPKSTILKNNYGWFRDGATGLMMQWGKVVDQGEGKSWFDFPIPFPGACVNVQVTVNAEGVPANNYSTAYYFTLSGAEIGRDQKGAWWFAIGW